MNGEEKMIILKYIFILLLGLGLLGACGWIRYGRLPSPPVPSCASLSNSQQERLLKLFRHAVPSDLEAEVALTHCHDHCGFILFTGERDPEEAKKKIPAEINGWPVCGVYPGPRVFFGQNL